ncbi:Uncharacterised protein [Streptococcus pneumoniae]|nr:Uncharacterised protein [Streptococcus pneumoniae]
MAEIALVLGIILTALTVVEKPLSKNEKCTVHHRYCCSSRPGVYAVFPSGCGSGTIENGSRH